MTGPIAPPTPDVFEPKFAQDYRGNKPVIADEQIERAARVLTNVWGDPKQPIPTWIRVIAHRVLLEAHAD